jgi:hypothetical protein
MSIEYALSWLIFLLHRSRTLWRVRFNNRNPNVSSTFPVFDTEVSIFAVLSFSRSLALFSLEYRIDCCITVSLDLMHQTRYDDPTRQRAIRRKLLHSNLNPLSLLLIYDPPSDNTAHLWNAFSVLPETLRIEVPSPLLNFSSLSLRADRYNRKH